MRKILKPALFLLSFIIVVALQAGCGTVGKALNPYNSEFECPMTEKGKCVALPTAYNEAINANTETIKAANNNKRNEDEPKIANTNKDVYQENIYSTLNKLLGDPVTPIIAPPKVIRVLFLPYRSDSNDLLMFRYAYIMVDEPKWVLGEYLNSLTDED